MNKSRKFVLDYVSVERSRNDYRRQCHSTKSSTQCHRWSLSSVYILIRKIHKDFVDLYLDIDKSALQREREKNVKFRNKSQSNQYYIPQDDSTANNSAHTIDNNNTNNIKTKFILIKRFAFFRAFANCKQSR
jgi:hypothetical protein